ncbi:Homeobox domain-containing protein [Heracleum sosnowskyi]|uniref:Homeobox domain-containing protein n=1 Tax=Heracleum sosnowskyi TaxID=360622 RepID=A0AAD8MBR0_9APIA|nr:Homeobox domain-containing protein [Heracleum sosnowskyi]
MGRPPSHGAPAFRFNNAEVAEMEAMLQANNATVPAREVLEALAQKFSTSPERSGKFVVQMKKVWNWFQNRRYAIRARKTPVKLNTSPASRDDSAVAKNVALAPQPQHQQPQHAQPQHPQPQHPQPQHPQPHHPQPLHPQPQPPPLVTLRNVPQAPPNLPTPAGKNVAESTPMEFEAKSARDGAWYDVASFLSHRNLERGDPEVLVRFAGFGAEEDEWVDIRRHVRQRSLPCESSECVAVLPGDLILCFQEGKEQALYFDAHFEEIVPLRKVCHRPETDHRLQLLHALNNSTTAKQPKAGIESRTTSTLRVYPPPEVTEMQLKIEEPVAVTHILPATSNSNLVAGSETKNQQPNVSEIVDGGPVKILNAPPGSGIQLLEAPGLINPVIQKDPNVPPGNDAAIQDAVDKVATDIGDPNAIAENDAVLNEVDVNNADTNIEGDPNVTSETDDVLNEAATNIEEDINGTPENHAVLNEDAANTEEDTNGSPEDEAVSNEDAGNIEGDTIGMLEDEAELNEDAADIEGDTNGTP